ncbi:unnamed protein product [Amoebophrya sp. A120]|nr:unnamed protein product [Amoebophrya sp. A120]|eukprot:GSA120T00003402001.1
MKCPDTNETELIDAGPLPLSARKQGSQRYTLVPLFAFLFFFLKKYPPGRLGSGEGHGRANWPEEWRFVLQARARPTEETYGQCVRLRKTVLSKRNGAKSAEPDPTDIQSVPNVHQEEHDAGNADPTFHSIFSGSTCA